MKAFLIAVAAIVVITVLVVAVVKFPQYSNAPSTPTASFQDGPAPWSTEIDSLAQRLDKDNLPQLTQEGTVMHIHEHLDIYVAGKTVPVPEGIGINETAGFISAIHTHDSSGVIHVESPTVRDFTLGQFFDVWGVKFTDQCLGGYCTGNGKTLQLFINGQEIKSNFREQVLKAHQEIVLTFGSISELHQPIPASYNFPANQ